MKPINFVEKKWGSETWVVNELQYAGKLMTVSPGHSCSLHFHKNKMETFYVLEGVLKLSLYDWERCETHDFILNPGECYTLSPMTPHSFSTHTNETCKFIEFSTFHDDADTYRLTRSK